MVAEQDVALNQRILHPVEVDRGGPARAIVDEEVVFEDGPRDDPVDHAAARAVVRAVEVVVAVELDAGAPVAPDQVAAHDRPIGAVRRIDAVLGAGAGARVVLDDEVVGERREDAPAPIVIGAVVPKRDVVRDLHMDASAAAVEEGALRVVRGGRHSDDLESLDGHVGRAPHIDPVWPCRPGKAPEGGVERGVFWPRAGPDDPRPGSGMKKEGTRGCSGLGFQIEPVVRAGADVHRVTRLRQVRGVLERAPRLRRRSGSRVVPRGRDVVGGGPGRARREGGDESRRPRDRRALSHDEERIKPAPGRREGGSLRGRGLLLNDPGGGGRREARRGPGPRPRGPADRRRTRCNRRSRARGAPRCNRGRA